MIAPSKKLRCYVNGNTKVSIFEDGTKIREYDGVPSPVHPESIDVKITDFCDLGCPYCHESSTLQGKHGNLERLVSVIGELPPGVELAIGGGNPLSHPDLKPFLSDLKKKGFICNLTVNQGHLLRYQDLISYLLSEDLVKGLGISIIKGSLKDVEPFLELTDNIVYHVIAGVYRPHVLDIINHIKKVKTLVLGYKTFGRGVAFNSPVTDVNIKEWGRCIGTYIQKYHLSFDNLAIEQLKLKRLFTDEGWQRFYMGDDGQFTMYIDAVLGNYAKTSRCLERVSFDSIPLKDFFLSLGLPTPPCPVAQLPYGS